MTPIKIIFVISEDWYFYSHRIPLAEEAIRRGWKVILLSRISTCAELLYEKKIKYFQMDLERGSLNPFRDIRYCFKLYKFYRKEQPDIVHHVALKPCLYGSIAAVLSKIPCIINAVAGFGTLFSSHSPFIQLARPLVMSAFCFLFRHHSSKLILQNTDDVIEFEQKLKLSPNQIRLIRGSGVDMDHFHPPAIRKKTVSTPLVVMVSRLLRDKGLLELIEAARILEKRNVSCRIALVGDSDSHNRSAVSDDILKQATSIGSVEFWGKRYDIPDIYRQADIAVLPSYREGLPKSLIEAAACGLPIITTDVPGCREVVNNSVNGYLVPAKQPIPLADAMEKLINSPGLRHSMGQESRKKALAEFDIKYVVEKTFKLYNELLSQINMSNKRNLQ